MGKVGLDIMRKNPEFLSLMMEKVSESLLSKLKALIV